MDSVSAYIDGYNLYHSIKYQGWNCLLWLDIPALMKCFLTQDQELEWVYYFTSDSPFSDSRSRQIIYNEALQTQALISRVNFKIIRGRFSEPNDVKCLNCHQKPAVCGNEDCQMPLNYRVEKETDVNMALKMIDDAYEDNFKLAFLVTADSDQVGTVKFIKRQTKKRVVVIFPPERKSDELREASENDIKRIKLRHLEICQLPNPIIKANGIQLKKPLEWN